LIRGPNRRTPRPILRRGVRSFRRWRTARLILDGALPFVGDLMGRALNDKGIALSRENPVTEPNDPFPLKVTEAELWGRAAASPALPFLMQETAIEELLREESAPLLVIEAPPNHAASLTVPTPSAPAAAHEPIAVPPEPNALVEEFKPTDAEWENVKESLLPHPDAVPIEEKEHPAYKPEILERDAQGRDGAGDWNQVETAKHGAEPDISQ
jgi:hypothetical protein